MIWAICMQEGTPRFNFSSAVCSSRSPSGLSKQVSKATVPEQNSVRIDLCITISTFTSVCPSVVSFRVSVKSCPSLKVIFAVNIHFR